MNLGRSATAALHLAAACSALGLLIGAVDAARGGPLRAMLAIDGGLMLLIGLLIGPLWGWLRPAEPSRWTLLAAVMVVLPPAVVMQSTGEALDQPWLEQWRTGQKLPRIGGEGPLLVLITLDTLRADAPMERLNARKGLHYQRAHTPAPWTLPAMASLVTGLDPVEHGAGRRVPGAPNASRTALEEGRTLWEELRERGYISVGVTTNSYLGVAFGVGRGLDRHYDLSLRAWRRSVLRKSIFGAGLPEHPDDARHVTDRALQVLERGHEGRMALWVHYLDAHAPYEGWNEWMKVRRGEVQPDTAALRAAYDRDARVLDQELDRLLEALWPQVEAGEALVIVAGDHGEAFGEDGFFEHGSDFHDTQTLVPLHVFGAGEGEVDRAVDLVGVRAALLSWLDRGDLGPLSPEGPDAVTPMAGLLFGEERGACHDGRQLHREDSPDCPARPMPEGEGAVLLQALQALGYVD